MKAETDVGLVTRMKLPLAVAMMAGTLAAAPVLAQTDYYYDDDDELTEEHYDYRPVVRVQDDEPWHDDDVDDWFDDDGTEYRVEEWEFDTDPDVVIYDQYHTVEYDSEPSERFFSGDRVRPGADETVAEDTDYYYDPDRDEAPARDRVRTRIHQTEPPVRIRTETQQQSMTGSKQVSGELQSYREISLQGQPEPHTIVKVRTADGRTALVNLGPRVNLRDMGLQQGDTVVAEGRRGTINNEPVLIATSIRSEGQARQLQTSTTQDELWLQQRGTQQSQAQQQRRQQQQMQRQQSQQMQREYRTSQPGQMTSTTTGAAGSTQLRGNLQSFGEVELQGQQDPHTIVELRLDDGQRALVNLGPDVSPQDLNLQRGDTVTVEGRRGKINRQPVLMATSIEANGQRTQIRQPQAMGSGQQDAVVIQQEGGVGPDEELREQDESGYLYTTERVAQVGQSGQGQQVNQIVMSWPAASKEAATQMQSKYGEPDAKTPEMLVWNDTGPFVRTVVHKEAVQHNFPTPHDDVLEQCVKYQVPAEKMDDLAMFDGSITVSRTEGLMSARCHKEDMNILALNLADKVIKDELSVQEARTKLAETAKAYENGDRPPLTQELQFETSGNTEEPDSPAGNTGSGSQRNSSGNS